MGLRNQFVDRSVGIKLPVDRFTQAHSWTELGNARAIEVVPHRKGFRRQLLAWTATTSSSPSSSAPQGRIRRVLARYDLEKADSDNSDISELMAQESHYERYCSYSYYALNWSFELVLNTVPATEEGSRWISIIRAESRSCSSEIEWLVLALAITGEVNRVLCHVEACEPACLGMYHGRLGPCILVRNSFAIRRSRARSHSKTHQKPPRWRSSVILADGRAG